MTVAVTGAAGHVGGNLVRELLARGRSVRAVVHRDTRALEDLDVELVPADVRDAESLQRAFKGADVVFHTAAQVSLSSDRWPLLEAVNVVGTRNVVTACLECDVGRLVHFSSIHALQQEPLQLPVDEERPLVDPGSSTSYDLSKAESEREVRHGIERGLDAVLLNPTAIIGPWDFRPSHFGRALLAMGEGRLPALVAGGFNWVDVRDVIAAALQAEDRAPTGAKYLLPGHWVSLADVASRVAEITGVTAPRFVCPTSIARLGVPLASVWAWATGTEPLFTAVSLQAIAGSNRSICQDRAVRDLGYAPRPFQETLEDTLAWFARTGRLARPVATRPLEVQ